MNADDPDPFYIGWLPQMPATLARVSRRGVVVATVLALGAAGLLAVTLPYFGDGVFEFGRPQEFTGTVRCEPAPRLSTGSEDYLLVGFGKNGVAPEICGVSGREATVRGTLIRREGRQLIEVSALLKSRPDGAPPPAVESLGRFTLTGEIVDSKCYFGVMNPAEGRAHRACAVQCLRGGIPAVFVARDRAGATSHLLITGPDGKPMNAALLRWAGEGVEASGEILRQGKWLVWRIEPGSIRSTQRREH